MGVIFEDADDVAACLIPFIQARQPGMSAQMVERAYHELSLGQHTSAQFWDLMGLPQNLDAEYLCSLRLDPTFFPESKHWPAELSIGVLSNDAVEWSYALRQRHQLEGILGAAVISGECGS